MIDKEKLDDFERRLKAFVKKENITYPIPNEVIEEFLNTLEPTKISKAFGRRLMQTMKRASEKRRKLEKKEVKK